MRMVVSSEDKSECSRNYVRLVVLCGSVDLMQMCELWWDCGLVGCNKIYALVRAYVWCRVVMS